MGNIHACTPCVDMYTYVPGVHVCHTYTKLCTCVLQNADVAVQTSALICNTYAYAYIHAYIPFMHVYMHIYVHTKLSIYIYIYIYMPQEQYMHTCIYMAGQVGDRAAVIEFGNPNIDRGRECGRDPDRYHDHDRDRDPDRYHDRDRDRDRAVTVTIMYVYACVCICICICIYVYGYGYRYVYIYICICDMRMYVGPACAQEI
jgi:hypothetical protein